MKSISITWVIIQIRDQSGDYKSKLGERGHFMFIDRCRLLLMTHFKLLSTDWPKLPTWLVGSEVIRTEIDQIIEPGGKWKYDEVFHRYGDGATEHFLNINCKSFPGTSNQE